MNIHGGDIYSNPNMLDFSTNINPLGVPEGVIHAAKAGVERSHEYPDVHCKSLISGIAELMHLKEEQILCGNGAAELIFRLVYAVKPRRALITAPTFAEYELALNSVDCTIDYFYLKEEEGFQLTKNYLKYIYEELDVIFLCNPNNPTGEIISPEIMKEILEKVKKYNIYLIVDECFVDFLDEEEDHTLIAEIEKYNNLFILKAFTKMYAMAGLRLGYGITSNQELIHKIKASGQPWSVSIPAQEAGIAAIKEEKYRIRAKKLIRDQRAYLIHQLNALGFRIYGSHANYIFFHSKIELYESLKEEGILIRDCSNYRGLIVNNSNYYYRISVRRKSENNKLLHALTLILQKNESINEKSGGS